MGISEYNKRVVKESARSLFHVVFDLPKADTVDYYNLYNVYQHLAGLFNDESLKLIQEYQRKRYVCAYKKQHWLDFMSSLDPDSLDYQEVKFLIDELDSLKLTDARGKRIRKLMQIELNHQLEDCLKTRK